MSTRSEKAEAAHTRLVDEIEKLETSDDWKAALDVASKFHRYSFNNQILIATQAADRGFEPTYVMPYGNRAGTTGWKSVGRCVRKGEKGLGIFAPIRRKIEDDDGTETFRVVGFRIAHVFDISQTDGDPLPEAPAPTFLTGEALDVAPLVDYAAELGFTVELVEPDDDRLYRGSDYANGVTNYPTGTILVRNDTSPLQTFKTLVHELGHAALHRPDTDRPNCQGRVEVEAESVAYVVSSAFGLDTADYSFGYIAGWASNGGDKEPSKIVAETGQRVVAAAHKIIEALEGSEE